MSVVPSRSLEVVGCESMQEEPMQLHLQGNVARGRCQMPALNHPARLKQSLQLNSGSIANEVRDAAVIHASIASSQQSCAMLCKAHAIKPVVQNGERRHLVALLLSSREELDQACPFGKQQSRALGRSHAAQWGRWQRGIPSSRTARAVASLLVCEPVGP